MNTRLLLTLLVLLGLVTAGLLWMLGTETASEAPLLSATGARVDSQPVDSPAEAAGPVAAVSPGAATPQPGDRLAVDEGGDRLEVLVTVPAGAPADPELSVVVVPSGALEDGSPFELLERLRTGEDLAEPWGRAPVAADGRADLRLPPGIGEARVLVDGRFLFLEQPRPVGAGVLALELEPRLGACLTVRLDAPAQDSPAGSLALTGGDFSGGSRWQRREREAQGGNELTFRALDPRLTWSLMPSLDEHHADPQLGLELEPGTERTLDLGLTRGAVIAGVVVDGAGAPAPEVEVRTVSASPWYGGSDVRRTETDDSGRFELDAVGPGSQQVEAEAEGFKTARSEDLELTEGQRLEGVRLVLDRGASIAGRVLWSDGQSAADAEVEVLAVRQRGWGNWGGSGRQSAGEGRTDGEGRFRVSGLDEGTYSVVAEIADPGAEGEEDPPLWRCEERGVATGRDDVVLTLQGPLAFAGRVVDDRGEPLESFRIEVRSESDGGPRESQAFDDEQGRFRFARVGPGEWRVTASAPSHVQEQEAPLTLPRAGDELELVLQRTAQVAGRVVDPNGRPVRDARVQVDDGRSRGNPWGGSRGPSAQTDREGHFLLEELSPGSLTLVAVAEEWADSEALALELQPAESRAEVLLSLRTGGRIEGAVVTSEGDPMPGRRVTWGANAMGFGNRGETRTDTSGLFAFDHVTPGEWAVSAAPSMAEMSERMRGRRDQGAFVEVMGELVSETVSVADGEVVEVYLGGEPRRPVRLVGLVSRAGEPVPGAQVYAVSEGSAVFEGMKTVRADDDGAYELVVDRPGPHVVSASFESVGVEAVVDVPREDELRVDLEIPLGAIEGVVRGPDGAPAAGMRLSIQREDGLGRVRWAGGQGTTDERGRFLFEALEAGRYTVRANVAGWGSRGETALGSAVRSGVIVEADVATGGVDFELQRAGAVQGRVVGPDGSPLGGVAIFFRDAGSRLVSSVSGTVSDGSGRFRREGLSPGEYLLSARGEGFAAGDAASVRVASGETGDVQLELEPATWILVSLEDEAGRARRVRVEVVDGDGREVGGLLTPDDLRAAFNEGRSSLERRVGPIPPGRYTVRATTADGRSAEKRLWVRGRDSEKTLRLRIEP